MHASEEVLQRLVDGELSEKERTAWEMHLGSCPECRNEYHQLQQLSANVDSLLTSASGPSRRVRFSDIVQTAAIRRQGRMRRNVAGILLAFGLAGAAYAMPGSPLPALFRSVGDLFKGGGSPAPLESDSPSPSPSPSGISVHPGESFSIVFEPTEAGGEATLVWSAGAEVAVTTDPGAAQFSSAPGILTIRIRRADASVRIEIPTAARQLTVLSEERVLFQAEEGSVLIGPSPGPNGESHLSIPRIHN